MTFAAPIIYRKRVLATIVGLTAALVLGGIPAIPSARAQQGPSIAFLSPSRPPDLPIISDREADGDTSFRLAAWVANPPANPIVEFEIDVGAIKQTLGPAVQSGTDTWEFQWNVAGIPDGNYLMHAILFDGTTLQEVASNQLTVALRHGEIDPGAGAARVEIVSPSNGGAAGFFRPPEAGKPANIIIDYVRSTNTTFVHAQYTLTPAGQAPTWKSCTDGYTPASRSTTRCTLAAGDDPAQVTALRLVANATVGPDGAPEFDQAADTVRVSPYLQVPTSLNVGNPKTREIGLCSETFTATLTDQNGSPIAGANVDVHATGPVDELRFDMGRTTHSFGPPSPNQAPDAGPHTTQAGFDCFLLQTSDRSQGNHRRPGDSDVKHIESSSTNIGGTSDAGTFSFALHSPVAGDTHVTVWADVDNNDEHQAGEPCVATAIGWAAEEPPLPQPEFAGCGIGSDQGPQAIPASVSLEPAGQSAPVEQSASLVATVTAEDGSPVANEPVTWETSGVGTIAFSDETTDSAGRATAQLTSDTTGDQVVTVTTARCSVTDACSATAAVQWVEQEHHARRITIGFARRASGKLAVRGRVSVPDGFQECGEEVPVRVQRRKGGRWVTLKRATTDGGRRYAVQVANRSGRYRALAPPTTKGLNAVHVCEQATKVRRR